MARGCNKQDSFKLEFTPEAGRRATFKRDDLIGVFSPSFPDEGSIKLSSSMSKLETSNASNVSNLLHNNSSTSLMDHIDMNSSWHLLDEKSLNEYSSFGSGSRANTIPGKIQDENKPAGLGDSGLTSSFSSLGSDSTSSKDKQAQYASFSKSDSDLILDWSGETMPKNRGNKRRTKRRSNFSKSMSNLPHCFGSFSGDSEFREDSEKDSRRRSLQLPSKYFETKSPTRPDSEDNCDEPILHQQGIVQRRQSDCVRYKRSSSYTLEITKPSLKRTPSKYWRNSGGNDDGLRPGVPKRHMSDSVCSKPKTPSRALRRQKSADDFSTNKKFLDLTIDSWNPTKKPSGRRTSKKDKPLHDAANQREAAADKLTRKHVQRRSSDHQQPYRRRRSLELSSDDSSHDESKPKGRDKGRKRGSKKKETNTFYGWASTPNLGRDDDSVDVYDEAKATMESLARERHQRSNPVKEKAPVEATPPDPSQMDPIMRFVLYDLWKPGAKDVELALHQLCALYEESQQTAMTKFVRMGGVSTLIGVLHRWYNNAGIQQEGLRLLSTAASRSEEVAASIISCHGLETVLLAMKNFRDNAHVQSTACSVLYHLTETSDKEPSVRLVCHLNGVVALLRAMKRFPDSLRVQEEACMTFCSLARFPELRSRLAEGVPSVRAALERHTDQTNAQTPSLQHHGGLAIDRIANHKPTTCV